MPWGRGRARPAAAHDSPGRSSPGSDSAQRRTQSVWHSGNGRFVLHRRWLAERRIDEIPQDTISSGISNSKLPIYNTKRNGSRWDGCVVEGARSHGTCSAECNLRRSRAPGGQASQTPTAARQKRVQAHPSRLELERAAAGHPFPCVLSRTAHRYTAYPRTPLPPSPGVRPLRARWLLRVAP